MSDGPACPRCGGVGRPGAMFCDRCGALLAAPGAPLPLDGLTLETERKHISVLFADISGSTRLIAGLDPERAWALLEPVLQIMMEAVRAYGGTVTQIQGDGIMALLGAPLAQEDHALRACYAAARMHQELARAPWNSAAGPTSPIAIHVGIATGPVLVGTIGSGLARVYNATGRAINVAARLDSLAGPGQTFCMGETLDAAGFLARGHSLGQMQIRGLDEPVEVFELREVEAAPRHMRVRTSADGERGLAPLHGRAREVALLRARLALARSGHGQVVALVGDPGLGKSRLVWELSRRPELDGVLVLETGGASIDAESPYHVIAGLLRGLFGVEEPDDAALIRRKATDALSALGPEALPVLAPALALLGLDPDDGSDWAMLEPQARREAIHTRLLGLLLRLARSRPLLLIVEDMHWADRESLALLDALIEQVGNAAVMLLVSYRPDYHPGWSERGNVRIVPLTPLARADALHLAAELVGDRETHARLGATLIERTGGNPFFLQETVRTLAEAGVLSGGPGAWRLVGEWSGGLVPTSVQVVLQARIDRLPPEDKRLLQAASALGERFPLALLRALLGDVPPERLTAQLYRLRRAQLLDESSLFPEPRYAFTHALTRDVAYASLPLARRREVHAAVVAAFESTYQSRLAEHVEELAHHAANAESWDRLATYARLAGQRAASHSAFPEATQRFEQALAALARLPVSAETTRTKIGVRFELRNALFPLGQIARDLESMRAAEVLAREAGESRQHAWITAFIARDLGQLGRPDEALEASHQAVRLAGASGDTDLRVLARSYVSQAHYAMGAFVAAADVMRDLLRDTAANDRQATYGLPFSGRTAFRCWLAWPLARMDAASELVPLEDALLAEDARSDQPLAATVAQYSAGFGALGRGDFTTAIVRLEEARRRCERWGFLAWFTNIASALGHALVRAGRIEEGRDLLWHAVRRSRALKVMVSHSLEVAWLADATTAAGRVEEARTLAAEALDLARRHNERGNEAVALAAAFRATPLRADAERLLHEAWRMAVACGMSRLAEACRRELTQRAEPG